MPFFGTTGPEYDKNKKRAKELKKGDKEDRKERRSIKRMNRKERENVLNAAAKSKISEIIDKTGRIIGIEVIKQVPEYKKRLKNGKCIYCNTAAPRRGYIHDECKALIREMPSSHEIKLSNKTSGLGKGIPDGQNMNGIVTCVNKHRAFYYEAHGKWDCSQGCNS